MERIKEIVSVFDLDGEILDVETYGNGHINNTYKVTIELNKNKRYYILQRINDRVFSDIKALMCNIEHITAHILKKTILLGGDANDCLKIIKTKNGDYFYTCNTGFYRCYNFITSGISIESVPSDEYLRISGIGFGRFQRLLDDFPAGLLNETIPNFHNTEDRFTKFINATQNNLSGRGSFVKSEIEFFKDRYKYTNMIIGHLKSGALPLRVTHNDTKLNNILINTEKMRPVAVIDLDTVMPSTLLYDYGDALRYGTNTAAEDETNLDLVKFSFKAFESFTMGFLSEVKTVLTPTELSLMAVSGLVMTYECGMRFLTDYLNGDKYFKVHKEHHNLDRARTQIKLLMEMEKHIERMQSFISNNI
ncbi:MAG: aminoglycoside phosphotransferase family protein [Christensenellaceae bacterium]|jgi:hypothetical protein|nr:aminoglycoside phosphotransferase family protein [Christensenellaceae bacterium]